MRRAALFSVFFAMLSSCTFAKGNVNNIDGTIIGIDINVAQYGSLTLGYKSARAVSVPVVQKNEDGSTTATTTVDVPSVRSVKSVTTSIKGEATITDELNIGGLE